MIRDPERVRLEEIDWPAVLPFLRLLRSFRMAIHPPKLLLSLLYIVLIFLFIQLLDFVGGRTVHPGEFQTYLTSTPQQFDAYLANRDANLKVRLRQATSWLPDPEGNLAGFEDRPSRFADAADAINAYFDAESAGVRSDKLKDDERKAVELAGLAERRRQTLAELRGLRPAGVFDSAMHIKLEALGALTTAALSMDFGIDRLAALDDPESEPTDRSVLGVLWRTAHLPAWMWRTHPWMLAIYSVGALALFSVLGGAVTRLAALHATRDERATAVTAIAFAYGHGVWFALSPLIPLFIVGMLGLALALGGLALFNLPGLDILGGLLFGVAILIGLVMALLLIGLAAGAGLLFPAVAVEGGSAFDAVSRAFSYVIARPWRWLFYNTDALVYGAVTYLFVGTVVFATLWVVHRCVGAWVFTEAGEGVNRFDAIFPPPRVGTLMYDADWSNLDWSGRGASALVAVWAHLALGLVLAYVVSYVLTVNTWIYLLLRHSCDGTTMEEVYLEEPEDVSRPPAVGGLSKVEPAAEADGDDDAAPPSQDPPGDANP